MDFQIRNFVEILTCSLLTLLSFIFSVLALFVLVHYIRRRYKLYKEIKRIPRNLLILQGYKNLLKNLKLKCIINNFIVVILMIEIAQNACQIILFLPSWIIDFLFECPLYLEPQYFILFHTSHSLYPVINSCIIYS